MIPRRIAVRIAVADPALAERLILHLSGADDLTISPHGDVIVAERPGGSPSIIIALQELDGDIRAVLPADADGALLQSAIRVVAAGFVISEAEGTSAFADDLSPIALALTAREGEVLRLLAHGASNKSIARVLDISVHTAKFHVASLLAKLGARNRSDAIVIAIRHGLLLL